MAVRTTKSSTFLLIMLVSVFFFLGTNDAEAVVFVEADCAQCHVDIYGDGNLAPRQVLHHDRAAELGWIGFEYCANCHATGLPQNPLCTDCHGDYEHQNETHSNTNIATDCAACHSSPLIAQETHKNNCFGCHTSDDPLVIDTISDGLDDIPVN